MTSPAAGKAGDTEDAPAVLSVVTFVQRDPILGGDHPAVGVVVEVGEQLGIRPLAGYLLHVDPAAVHVVTAAALTGATGGEG